MNAFVLMFISSRREERRFRLLRNRLTEASFESDDDDNDEEERDAVVEGLRGDDDASELFVVSQLDTSPEAISSRPDLADTSAFA